jgi:hypothetical protein
MEKNMETQLTLRMDEKIIHAGEHYAQRQGVSLSKLIADYLQMITAKAHSAQSGAAFEPTPILSEITGVLQKTPCRQNLREEYLDYLEEKYL